MVISARLALVGTGKAYTASRSLSFGLKNVCTTSVRAKPLSMTTLTMCSLIWIGAFPEAVAVRVPAAKSAGAVRSVRIVMMIRFMSASMVAGRQESERVATDALPCFQILSALLYPQYGHQMYINVHFMHAPLHSSG